MAMLGMGAMFSQSYGPGSGGSSQEPRRESPEERQFKKQRIDAKINKAHGLTEFKYAGGNVWALNQKSADKKAHKLGLTP